MKRKKDINMSAMLLSFISQWVLFNTIENYTYNTDWSKKNFITISWKKHDSTQLNFDALNDMTRLSWYWNWIKTVYRRGSWDSDGAIYLSFEMSKNEVETKFLSEWLEWCEGVKNWLWDILYIWLAPMLPLEVNEPFWKWSWDFFVCNAEKQEKNILSSNDENDDQELRVELMNKKTGVKTPAYGYINSKAQKPDQIALFTKEGCSFCAQAKDALAEAGLDYVELPLPHQTRTRILGAITGDRTAPQIFINGKHIGDQEALNKYLAG